MSRQCHGTKGIGVFKHIDWTEWLFSVAIIYLYVKSFNDIHLYSIYLRNIHVEYNKITYFYILTTCYFIMIYIEHISITYVELYNCIFKTHLVPFSKKNPQYITTTTLFHYEYLYDLIHSPPFHFKDIHELHVCPWRWFRGAGALWDGLCNAVALPNGGLVLLTVWRHVYCTRNNVQCQVEWSRTIYLCSIIILKYRLF